MASAKLPTPDELKTVGRQLGMSLSEADVAFFLDQCRTPGKPARLVVKAWRGCRLRLVEGEPDARGEGVLLGTGALAPLAVAASARGRGGGAT